MQGNFKHNWRIPVFEWLISHENVRSLKLFARWSTGNHDLLVLDTIDKRYFGSVLKSFCRRVRSDARLAGGYGNQIDQLSGRGRLTLGVPPADFPRFFLSAFSFSSSSIISRSINVISVLQRRWSSYNQQQRWQPLWIKIIRMLNLITLKITLHLSVLRRQAPFWLLVPAILYYLLSTTFLFLEILFELSITVKAIVSKELWDYAGRNTYQNAYTLYMQHIK